MSEEWVGRQPPKRASASLRDLTLLVTVPGQPAAVRAFTDIERADAEAYAAVCGGVVTPLY